MKSPPTDAEEEAKRRSQALEALATYQKRGHVATDLASWAAMVSDESDRGVVVIIGSLMEDALQDCIERKFVALTPAEKKNLTRSGGLISSFSDKITLASALGLIKKDVAGPLEVIKAMRNACAHSRQKIDFATPELHSALALLLSKVQAEQLVAPYTNTTYLRFVFLLVAIFLFDVLAGKGKRAAYNRMRALVSNFEASVLEAKQKHEASLERRRERSKKRNLPSPIS